MDVSIVICCYNSSERLPVTLEHVSNLLCRNLLYELIIVDNNSNDDTSAVAEQIWKSLNKTEIKFNLVHEPNVGLTQARMKGVESSSGQYIVFCDDDNWLDSSYLHTAVRFLKRNPSVGIIGGKIEGILEGNKPDWWESDQSNFAVGSQAISSGDITRRGYLWGAGMVVRKNIVEVVYFGKIELMLVDRMGKQLSSGGDSELCQLAIFMGYKLWYLEDLKLSHFIPKTRLTDGYRDKLKIGLKSSHPVLHRYMFFNKYVNYYTNRYNKSRLVQTIKRLIKLILGKLNDQKQKNLLQMGLGKWIRIDPIMTRIIDSYEKLSNGARYR